MRVVKKLSNKIKLPSGFIVFLILIAFLFSIGIAVDQPMSLVNLPALAVVVLGTLLATALSFSFDELKLALKRVRSIEDIREAELTTDANQILHFAQLWFRKLYQLIDRDIEALDNEMLKKGLQMIRDRQSGEDIKALMSWKLTQEKERDMRAIKVIQSMVGYAPVFGLIGTLLGIMLMIQGFDASKGFEGLVMGVSLAFVSTLYGLLLSQLVLKPLVTKLEHSRAQHLKRVAMLAEGVVLIEQQRSPAQIRDILLDYIKSIQAEAKLEAVDTTKKHGVTNKKSFMKKPAVKKASNKASNGAARKPALLKFGA